MEEGVTYDFEIIGDHPHAGKRVRLVEGSAPGTVQGVTPPGSSFMALVEDEDGVRYYAGRSDLGRVTVTPLGPRRRGRRT